MTSRLSTDVDQTTAIPPITPYAADTAVQVIEPPLVGAGLAQLEARDITAWFGQHKVLDRVSLTMPAGEITALIGPSGCGKSTFLRILNRMHELVPSAALAGEVQLDGVDIYDPQRKLTDARRSIGMVFQKPNPFPAMSIRENVIAGLKLTGTKVSKSEKEALVEHCLIRGGLWKEVKDRLDVVLTMIQDGDHRLSRPQDIARIIAAVKEFFPAPLPLWQAADERAGERP